MQVLRVLRRAAPFDNFTLRFAYLRTALRRHSAPSPQRSTASTWPPHRAVHAGVRRARARRRDARARLVDPQRLFSKKYVYPICCARSNGGLGPGDVEIGREALPSTGRCR
jgi:hypothetical protein